MTGHLTGAGTASRSALNALKGWWAGTAVTRTPSGPTYNVQHRACGRAGSLTYATSASRTPVASCDQTSRLRLADVCSTGKMGTGLAGWTALGWDGPRGDARSDAQSDAQRNAQSVRGAARGR